MKIKLQPITQQRKSRKLLLKRINKRPGDITKVELNEYIVTHIGTNNVFLFNDEYFHKNDFNEVTIHDDSGNELIEEHYGYITPENISIILSIVDVDYVNVSMAIFEVGCRIKRKNYLENAEEYIVIEKPVDDNNFDTFAYRREGKPEIIIGTVSSDEFYSLSMKTVIQFKPIDIIKFLLTQNNDCQMIMDQIRQIVFK